MGGGVECTHDSLLNIVLYLLLNQILMKSFILSLILLFAGAMVSNAQTSYTTDASGTLIQQQVIHSEEDVIGNAEPTGQKFKASNGEMYDVYKSAKGRLFIVRESKTGNHYKQYLEEVKQ